MELCFCQTSRVHCYVYRVYCLLTAVACSRSDRGGVEHIKCPSRNVLDVNVPVAVLLGIKPFKTFSPKVVDTDTCHWLKWSMIKPATFRLPDKLLYMRPLASYDSQRERFSSFLFLLFLSEASCRRCLPLCDRVLSLCQQLR